MKKTLILSVLVVLTACKKDEPDNTPAGKDYASGVFITNEGMFSSGSGTLGWYDPEKKQYHEGVFGAANGFELGSVVQSIARHNGRAYIVVNNSGRVEVMDVASLDSKGSIGGLSSPRSFSPCNAGTGLITDWVSNSVKVVDLASNTVTHSLTAGEGPEQMLWVNNALWVANSGGFVRDSTIFIFSDPCSGSEVHTTLTVGDNPGSLAVDANGKVWVLCAGYQDWANPANDTPGRLMRINPANNSVELDVDLGSMHPARLQTSPDGNTLYFLSSFYGGELYSFPIQQTTAPASAFISGSFYGFGVDPDNGEIYLSDALTFDQNGVIYRYDTQGTLIHQFTGGVVPGNFSFE